MKHTSRTRFSIPELGFFTRGWATAITCRKINHSKFFWNDEIAKWNTSRIPLLKHKENNNISTCNFISGEMVKKVVPIYLQNLRLDH